MNPHIEHCLEKIAEIVARDGGERRSTAQLGYNLGRLSELTGLGREACWDRWTEPVAAWDQPRLLHLARELRSKIGRVEARAPSAEERL